MKLLAHTSLLAVFFLAGASAQETAATYTGSTDVEFQGSSNLHPFEGTVSDVPLEVTLAGDVLNMKTQVTIRDMTTDNKKRDKDMWSMFKVADYPAMKVSVTNASYAAARPQGEKPGSLPVKLTVAGKTVEVKGTTVNLKETASGGSFDLKLALSLKEMGLEAPVAMLGALKVHDRVNVVCHVTLTKKK